MASRSSNSGIISFGMVSVPVRMFAVIREKEIRFHQVHVACGSRTNAPTVCRTCDREVERTELVKGYDTGNGIVLLEEQDFETLPLESSKAIQVTRFVPAEELPVVMTAKSYYLAPDERTKAPQKGFVLLRDVLQETGQAAIGKLARSGKEQLVALLPEGRALLMLYLHWPDEVSASGDVEALVDDVEVSVAERRLAKELVSALAGPFEGVREEKDEYRAALEELIASKEAGKPLPAMAERSAPAPDMLDALRASIEAAKQQKEAA